MGVMAEVLPIRSTVRWFVTVWDSDLNIERSGVSVDIVPGSVHDGRLTETIRSICRQLRLISPEKIDQIVGVRAQVDADIFDVYLGGALLYRIVPSGSAFQRTMM